MLAADGHAIEAPAAPAHFIEVSAAEANVMPTCRHCTMPQSHILSSHQRICMQSMVARLKKLRESSRSNGLYAIAAAADAALSAPEDLDNQLNLVGALHESGKLRNVLEPYWTAWRVDESPWIQRAAERLLRADSDYWALAALIGCAGKGCIDEFGELGLTVRAKYSYSRFDLPDVRMTLLAGGESEGALWAPVIEIGEDSESGEVVDVRRFRAIHWQSPPGGALRGNGSYYLRALLPHGSWRVLHHDIDPL